MGWWRDSYPDEEDKGPEVALFCADHVRRNNSDDGVPELGGGEELDGAGCGGRSARRKKHTQLLAVERATPRARIGRGKISPIKTQAPGPQVEAKQLFESNRCQRLRLGGKGGGAIRTK